MADTSTERADLGERSLCHVVKHCAAQGSALFVPLVPFLPFFVTFTFFSPLPFRRASPPSFNGSPRLLAQARLFAECFRLAVGRFAAAMVARSALCARRRRELRRQRSARHCRGFRPPPEAVRIHQYPHGVSRAEKPAMDHGSAGDGVEAARSQRGRFLALIDIPARSSDSADSIRNQCLFVWSTYPRWLQPYNFNGWQERSYWWEFYRCGGQD